MSPAEPATTSVAGSDRDGTLNGLEEAQRAAVTNEAQLLAVIAAAGSGKTTVLTRRIAHRVQRGDALARHVLALTFTRQAAGELRRRLHALGLSEPIEAGTFHAIAYRSLRQRARDTGSPEPTIVTDRMRLLREAVGGRDSRTDLSALAAEIDWARARLIAADEYPSAARSAKRRSSVAPPAVTAAMDAYAALKRRRGVLDMDDLLGTLLHHMRTDKQWADAQRWRYRHLVVDEAQDLNPLQHAVLEAWRGGRDDLTLVGDPRQAIYGWNGADPTFLSEVERAYPGVTIVRLTANRRSTPQVVRAAAGVLARAGLDDDSVARRPDGLGVSAHVAPDEATEARLIARLLSNAREPGARWASMAVLARTNAQLAPLAEGLRTAGIPAAIAGRSAVTPRDAALAETYACRSREELAAWAERVLATDDGNHDRCLVAEVLDLYLTRTAAGGRDSISWRAWLELTAPLDGISDDVSAGDAVAVSTFHGAKGREWSTVVLAGMEHGLVPHASALTSAQRDEEARLVYVALTRAADRAFVTSAARREGRATRPSPFLADIESGEDNEIVAPPPLLVAGPRAATQDPVLSSLQQWRATAAIAAGIDPASLLSDRALQSIAKARPSSPEELAAAAGVGVITARRLWPRLERLLR